MFALINRMDVGLFLWTTIGLAIGYATALVAGTRGPRILVAMAVGLLGAVGVGLGLGIWLSGYRLWICNLGAAAGSFVLAAGWRWLAGPGEVRG